MSIARALVEYIHGSGKGAKTLFATHYHELNDLEKLYPRVKNYHIAVKEEGRNVIFLRKMEPGGTLSSLRRQLEEADLNNMTPMQAFDLLRKMKQELGLS